MIPSPPTAKGLHPFPFSHLSIQQRLPLLICILLIIVVATFTWMSYLGVKEASLAVGRERLTGLAEQLQAMFQASSKGLVSTTRATANLETIREFVRSGGKHFPTEAFEALKQLGPPRDSLSIVELYDGNRSLLLRVAQTVMNMHVGLDSGLAATALGPDSTILGRIRVISDSMYYPVVAAVLDGGRPIGYLLRWRLLQATPKSVKQLSELLGTRATIYFGNDDGSLWTDMIAVTPRPPIDMPAPRTIIEYSRPGEGPVIAAVRPVAGSHWILLVEFAQRTVLEAADRFVRWLTLIGVLLIVTGIAFAWIMSRNMTRPLKQLTVASAAIAAGDYSTPVEIHRNDELGVLAHAFNTMATKVHEAQSDLELKVQERTTALETALSELHQTVDALHATNKELESFSYSVSHDLRAPLRSIDGFSQGLLRDYDGSLDDKGKDHLRRVRVSTQRMAALIDDMLKLSHITRADMRRERVDLSLIAREIAGDLQKSEPARRVEFVIADGLTDYGDSHLLRVGLDNLLGNSWKYTIKNPGARIEFGATHDQGKNVYYCRDNGVGFDMRYADKLFGAFQRLHSESEFEGTGIGLATVQRIINRHGGHVWAEGTIDEGATFYFSL